MMPIAMGASMGMGSGIPSKDDVAKHFPKIWVTIAAAISAHFAMGLTFMTRKAILETFH
jgi:hypothetical protein